MRLFFAEGKTYVLALPRTPGQCVGCDFYDRVSDNSSTCCCHKPIGLPSCLDSMNLRYADEWPERYVHYKVFRNEPENLEDVS